ncbi:hypothetical protein [Sporomusa sphaeroides]|nr:hypothetical protein [Sporomusa sphaeroides]HML33823.1 hypothetical protein [Sporomusa sphaeroides]
MVNKKTGRAKMKHKRPEPVVRQEPGKLTIIIYDIPPSLNDWHGMHWAAKTKVKKQWENMLIVLLRGYKRVEKPVVRITYYPDIERRRDKDNMTPKWIMDGLVKSGVIQDDNAKVVDLDWSIGPVVEIGRTEIVIWEGGEGCIPMLR